MKVVLVVNGLKSMLKLQSFQTASRSSNCFLSNFSRKNVRNFCSASDILTAQRRSEKRSNTKSYSNSTEQNVEQENVNHETAFFGNETVSREEKAEKVHEVFENVASKYDLMNDVMSAGIHRIWKDIFVTRLSPKLGIKLLDVAGGTGDITFRVLQHLHNQIQGDPKGSSKLFTEFEQDIYSSSNIERQEDLLDSKITVCDISENMLAVGKKRAAALGYSGVDWVCGDAMTLPFDNNTFDAYTIAYGMRNVVDIKKALSEAYRVLKPGGRFLCLEFSQVHNSLIRSVYDLYSYQLIPVMGQVIASDWDSYQYLVESIRKFPDQSSYKSLIEDAGFRRVSVEDLTFGVTAIHSGFKI